MAVDKLVDSTQLDSDLTSVANAIRAKSGGIGQLAFPAGFVSEIQAIPSGGGSTLPLSGNLAIMPRGSVSGDVVLDFPDCNLGLGRAFQEAAKASGAGPFKLTVICRTITSVSQGPGRLTYFCYKTPAFYEVEFICGNQSWAESDIGIFAENSVIETVSGIAFGLKSATHTGGTPSYTMFKNATKLRNISFRENYSAQLINFGTNAAFSDATLISLANALQVSTGSASLTLHATPKGRLPSIIGRIESVTRDAETYDRFVADSDGAVTLQSFITTTKGWTLA